MMARITTPWKGTGVEGDPYRPRLADDHPLPAGASCTDVTGQPAAKLTPAPNLYTVQVANVPATWLSAVEADATYAVLWSE